MIRQENGLEIARDERASGWIFQEVWDRDALPS